MKTKKGIKILNFICAIIILLTTVCPNITLAANEITNIIDNENLISTINLESKDKIDKKETNEIKNNILEKQTNETINNKNNISEDISNDKEDKIINEEKDNKEEVKEQEIEQEEIIEVVENEEAFIKMQQEKEKEIEKNKKIKRNISLRSTQNVNLYVIQLASYISTTVHNRADGYGILVRKIATNSSYSDVKQAFCIEMRCRFELWCT